MNLAIYIANHSSCTSATAELWRIAPRDEAVAKSALNPS
jgi:hypothetical protein